MRIAIVGAGVIGLSIAWRLSGRADVHDVVLVDPDPGHGASWVAGGMLAPITEAWPGEEELLRLGSASLALWPDFAVRLNKAAGVDPGLLDAGTLAVTVDSADAGELDRLAEFLALQVRAVETMNARRLRALEPTLGPSIRYGISVPEDLSVDNRRLVAALQAATASLTHLAASAREVRPGAVVLEDGSSVAADLVVVAAGAWSSRLHPALADRVRPVKGEVVRLRGAGNPLPGHTIRGRVRGRQVYLVPREDGVVVGATQYEAGFDDAVLVAGVSDLLRDAETVMPVVREYALVEAGVGFRPGSPDNLPIVESLEPGVVAATGHGRNGFLLAPITVERVQELL